jgi:hypothetical protein
MSAGFNALDFRNLFGDSLIGKSIITEAIGTYPGGIAKVVELDPDPKAPEIVIQVFHPTFGEIGIFDYERVRFA